MMMQLHVALNILLQVFLLLLLITLLFTIGLTSGRKHQSGEEDHVRKEWVGDAIGRPPSPLLPSPPSPPSPPPWLTFSTHDVELVMKEHENATILLLVRGKIHDCLSINFTYEPANPTIEPISNLILCPDLNSTIQSTHGRKIRHEGSTRNHYSATHPPSDSLPLSQHPDFKPRTDTTPYLKDLKIGHTGSAKKRKNGHRRSSINNVFATQPSLDSVPFSVNSNLKQRPATQYPDGGKIGHAGDIENYASYVTTTHPPSNPVPLSHHTDFKPRTNTIPYPYPLTPTPYPEESKIQHTGNTRKGLYTSPSESRHVPLHLVLIQDLLEQHGYSSAEDDDDDEVAAAVVVGSNASVRIVSRRVGKTVLAVTTNDSSVSVTDAFVRVSVIHTRALDVASDVVGWMYTIIWDVSYFPQIFLNWRRKSVEGFSLDHVILNFTAYLYYSLFNIAFCWIPFIREQFKKRYPRTINHVENNDVFYALYGLFIVGVEILQCFLYGRRSGGEARLSRLCVGLLSASVFALLVECVLVGVGVLWWIDVFYLMSYIKLIITLIKSIPQVYVIYRIKSTKGFSLAGVIMDFIGGIFSLSQMFFLSANSDDYLSIFTNFSKFGIAIFSLIIDIVYFTQHWYYHLRFREKVSQ